MRSFWFYFSCANCWFQLCLAAVVIYYWRTAPNNGEVEETNPYGILCSVLPRRFRACIHVVLVFFFTLVFYTSLVYLYDYCLDADEDSYDRFKQWRTDQNKRKRRGQKPLRKKTKPKPKPVKIEEPIKEWWSIHGDCIITESMQDFYLRKVQQTLDANNSSSSPSKSPSIKNSKNRKVTTRR